MIQINRRLIQTLTVGAILGLVLLTGFGVLHAERDDLTKAVFFVT